MQEALAAPDELAQSTVTGNRQLIASDRRVRSLSIVIPAYNEEFRLPPTLLRIHEFLTAKGYDAELIAVDDGSRDGTGRRLRELASVLPLLKVKSHARNAGKDMAVWAGIRASTKDAVLFSDADLSTPIEDLERLWKEYDRGCDIVIGSRRQSGAQVGIAQPLHRQVMAHVFNWMVSLLCIRGFRDTQCGFKLFRTEAIRRVLPRIRTRGFAFDVEILLRSRELGFKIAEVGVRWDDAEGSHVRALKHSSRMFLQLLKMRGLL
jgi:dolichyl-phosphate beta-glucosyltransferase